MMRLHWSWQFSIDLAIQLDLVAAMAPLEGEEEEEEAAVVLASPPPPFVVLYYRRKSWLRVMKIEVSKGIR